MNTIGARNPAKSGLNISIFACILIGEVITLLVLASLSESLRRLSFFGKGIWRDQKRTLPLTASRASFLPKTLS